MSTQQDLVALLQQDRKLNPIRRATIIATLIEEHGWSKTQVAQLMHKSPSYVSNHLRLLRLPDSIRDALLSGVITEGHGRALSTLSDSQDMIAVFEDIVRYNYSVRFTETVVDKKRETKRSYGKVAPEFKQLEADIRRVYHSEAHITRRKNLLHLTISVPYSVVGFRTIRTIARKLIGYMPE